jgi:aromatic-L-amino-acid decarboxylase
VWQALPDALRQQLHDLPLPERAATLDDLVATALRDVLPHAMGNGHPAFGWVNPPPSPAGTVFGGRETLRACILHPDTGSEHLATLVAEVVAAAGTLTAAG